MTVYIDDMYLYPIGRCRACRVASAALVVGNTVRPIKHSGNEGERDMSVIRNWLHDKAHRAFRDPKFLCRLYLP